MCALYVGNLHPDCTTATLYQKFSPFGRICNIHICTDHSSRRSLGYGYVNFLHQPDAEKALLYLNYDLVKGQPMRLMWAQKNYTKFNLSANLFVKNIHPDIDEKALHDMFSAYGTILSLKISKDKYGNNKEFGYVQFENEDSAKSAIDNLNGKLIRGEVFYVSKFTPRKITSDKFKNIYIKNFGSIVKNGDLIRLCERFGAIFSAKVMTNEDGESKGFGFVSFEDTDSAEKAVEELNGLWFGGGKLFVGKAKKKSERLAEVMANLQMKLQCALP